MDVEVQIRDTYKQQKHSKCVILIDNAPAEIRDSSRYKILKASCLNHLTGKSKEAHKCLDEVISVEPENAFAYYGKGLAFINEGSLQEAVVYFDTAIDLDPSDKMNKARLMRARAQRMMEPITAIKMEIKTEIKTENDKVVETKVKKKRRYVIDKGPVSCPICNKVFQKAFSLTRHNLLHTGERPHSCYICGYGFIQKSDLNRHIATHSDVANYACHICNKRFKTKKNLHCHLVTHTTVRPFKCDECGKAFRVNRLLRFHKATHKTVKTEHVKTEIDCDIKTEVKMEPNVILTEEFDEVMKALGGDTDGNDSITFGDIVSDNEKNSDLNFFLSLLSDVNRMTEQQKQDFRSQTLQTIKGILD